MIRATLDVLSEAGKPLSTEDGFLDTSANVEFETALASFDSRLDFRKSNVDCVCGKGSVMFI